MARVVSSVDVAIVGGGPGGLAIAKGILAVKPGLKVKVLERVPKLLPVGAGVSLTTNGLKALTAIDANVAKQVQAAGQIPKYSVLIGPDGECQDKELQNITNPFIGWSVLQSILYDSLPPETVCFGHRFERLEAGADGLTTLHFDSPAEPISARITIGCDGYFSRIRHQWLNDGDPAFAGIVAWRGQASLAELPFWGSRIGLNFWDGKIIAIYPGSPGVVVWTLTAPVAKLPEAGLAPYEGPDRNRTFSVQAAGGHSMRLDAATRKQRALAMAASLPEVFRSLIVSTSAESILEHGIYYRPWDTYPDTQLGTGLITLGGDAFHVIRPTGQGVNQALEDAAVLGACIARKGACEAALREYEALRLPRLKRVARASELEAAGNYLQDPAERKASWEQVKLLMADINTQEFVSLASLA